MKFIFINGSAYSINKNRTGCHLCYRRIQIFVFPFSRKIDSKSVDFDL